MNDQRRVYGSADLTPDVIRAQGFEQRGGGYDPAEVREFLEQVASAMEVLSSREPGSAMRRELQRNSEISSRVVLAGQETAERLREQAATDARSIIEDTKRLAEQLRDASREEVERTRRHVDELRAAFIDELRDMYDRVGATLYRFESASRFQGEGRGPAGGAAPHAGSEPVDAFPPIAPTEPAAVAPADAAGPTPAQAEGAWTDEPDVAGGWATPAWVEPSPPVPPIDEAEDDTPLLELRPAWTQLQDDAGSAPEASDEPGGEAVDEPLAEGEPLVDLSAVSWGEEDDGEPEEAGADGEALPAFVTEPEPAADLGEAASPDPTAGFSLEGDRGDAELAAAAPEELAADPTSGFSLDAPATGGEEVPAAPPEAPVAPEGFLDQPAAGPVEEQPSADDDTRAEALIAGLDQVLNTVQEGPPPLPEPPSLTPENGGLTPDQQALRTFVLQSLHEGHTREAIESHLQQHMGIAEPGPMIDALLAAPEA